ncbi:OVARIAN TUMOR DOMAIN-containing deubiquitinating enzyme 4-like isoform X2 [Rhodamnia argentea]|uniref:Ubiquitin thioesterase OTU n=1 Tax=Rhodamnia argentea TaxID=178133 RepID=A0ABM3HGW5_9MYRT|nr:OVARIAN TUMOR DOMAIN-containing deubiquitinating enzyme 4-like isoform X2 [Rhodamnia argentea]
MRTIPIGTMPKPENLIGIAGDGSCLFRSVIHGAYLKAGKQSPSESLQKQLADELRAKVADEFVKRRTEIEWFLEGDFDTYVAEMRQPHKWGGEPELLMCSHILQMPITVFMKERFSGRLKIIAEYGREYGTGNSINVLYHSYGHYDALLAPIGNVQSRITSLVSRSSIQESLKICPNVTYACELLPHRLKGCTSDFPSEPGSIAVKL